MSLYFKNKRKNENIEKKFGAKLAYVRKSKKAFEK